MKDKFLKRMEDAGAVLIGVMTLLVLFQVVTRYVFKSPPPWTEEIARYVMIWGTLIGSVVLVFEKGHINLDYFVNRFPPGLARVFRVIFGLVMVGFLVAFVAGGLEMVSTTSQITQRSPGAGLPMSVVYVILPVTGLLMLAAYLIDIYKAAKGR